LQLIWQLFAQYFFVYFGNEYVNLLQVGYVKLLITGSCQPNNTQSLVDETDLEFVQNRNLTGRPVKVKDES
jgi:hypothetical protein